MTATMEPLVDTLIEDPRWEVLDLGDLAERAAQAALAGVGLSSAGFEISLLGCEDKRIAELNADFRGKPQPTNVLSWPSDERGAAQDGGRPLRPKPGRDGMPEELGDIAIAYETCAREAEEQGKTLEDHVLHLLVHGTLHLLGYDHVRDGDAALMEGAETRILASMGIANPYEQGSEHNV
jgi:probable rRNA maturation factor